MPLHLHSSFRSSQDYNLHARHHWKWFFLACLLLWSTLAGCAGCAAKIRSAAAGSLVEDIAAVTARHDDVDLVAQAAPTYLLLLEGLLQSDPGNQRLLGSAAEAYVSYGALVEPDDPERARKLYRRAKDYGLRALAADKEIAGFLRAPYGEFIQIRSHLKPEDLPIVFWAASSWGAWVSTNTSSLEALADLPKVIALMEWILSTDESFYYGSPHLFLGMYYSALPPSLGGRPDKALHHFERAIEIGQRQSLMAYVLMAKYYARQIFDRGLYISLLSKVLELPADQVPELTLQNIAAKKEAGKLLEEVDAFF